MYHMWVRRDGQKSFIPMQQPKKKTQSKDVVDTLMEKGT